MRIAHAALVLLIAGSWTGCAKEESRSGAEPARVELVESYLDELEIVVEAAEGADDAASAEAAAKRVASSSRELERIGRELGGSVRMSLAGVGPAYGARVAALERRLDQERMRIGADPLLAKLALALQRVPRM